MPQSFFHVRIADSAMEYLSILYASAVLPTQEATWTNEVPATLKRRDPRIWQMAYVASLRAMTHCTIKPNSIVVATALGALDETKNFLDGVFTDGLGSPRNFIASVHNSIAGKLAQEFKVAGPNLTLCDGHNSLASAIGACSLLKDADFPALVVAVDENIELLNRLIPHLSPECKQALGNNRQEGAVAFILHNKGGDLGPRIRSIGPLFIGGKGPDAACSTLLQSQGPSNQTSVSLPSKTAGSFLSVPIAVREIFRGSIAGRYALCSFSPSSKAIAIVEVCR
jgi:hypothetical protein